MTAPTQLDRVMASSRNLERAELPELSLAGIFEYQVIAATPLGVSAVSSKPGMPAIQLVPAGAVGMTTLLAMLGTNVLVAFVNQDPGRPIVLSVAITATMLVDSGMTTGGGGPVIISTPLVAPLVAP